ncbi:nuclear transport factor 2 family protein [Thalassotalea sediminis]|uniref:nuclear transport factor 2 family protein n=1 Tax=Thalassotalea sediminis TaxID=1759089 RepID=UPI002574438F|nr:nuclear transport factor 2 family protein [Thalassotalea sediminis]
MNRNLIIYVFIFLTLTFTFSVKAEPSSDLIKAFISASEKARQPDFKAKDLEYYLSFFTDDFTDHHIAYGVSFTGKDNLRKGIIGKSASMVSVVETIEDIVLGTDTAVVVVNEDSKYYKNGKLKHFKGRNILVLEFNDQGLITQMRRYLD